MLFLFVAISGWPQNQNTPQPLARVREFLGLTDSQVTAILQNNNDYNAFSFQQQQQIRNAQSQIAVETAKDPLDPMALGALYAGIENACRELRDKAATSQRQNISILTDAQRVKLNVLNDAMKLYPIISEAQSGNLLGSTNSPPFAFSAFSSGIITGVTGFPPVSGCASPFPFPNVVPANPLAPVAPIGCREPWRLSPDRKSGAGIGISANRIDH